MADKIQHNTVEKLGDDYSKNYGMFSRFCLSKTKLQLQLLSKRQLQNLEFTSSLSC